MARGGELERIPYARPWLTELEQRYVAEALAEGRLIQGPWVARFEAGMARWIGREAAVAVPSGTAALQLALAALGVGRGWVVVVPAYTWVATYNAPHLAGAEVRLADVDPDTYLVTPATLARALEGTAGRRRLIIGVHMFGYRVPPEVFAPFEADGVQILGDGCCALGGLDGDVRCGAWTPVECLSFHPRKVITTGEGGMVLTDDLQLAQRCRRLRDHGAQRSAEQRRQTTRGGTMVPHFPEPGFNFRMTELAAALGVAQLERIEALIGARQQVAAWYDEALAQSAPWIRRPPGADDPGRVLTFYPVQLQGSARREAAASHLAARGIAVRTPMVDLPSQPFTRDAPADHPGTQQIMERTLGLPCFPQLTQAQAVRVVEALASLGAP